MENAYNAKVTFTWPALTNVKRKLQAVFIRRGPVQDALLLSNITITNNLASSKDVGNTTPMDAKSVKKNILFPDPLLAPFQTA